LPAAGDVFSGSLPFVTAAFSIRRIESDCAALRALIALSDDYLGKLYPSESNHLESAQVLMQHGALLLGVEVGGELIACGAVKILQDDGTYGEIKRVFVADAHRGKGISKAIMQALEAHLRESGVARARLETGIKQPEAIGLYRRLGYSERDAFGRYRPDPLSLFMEKAL
jgi:putative acetyltransferase